MAMWSSLRAVAVAVAARVGLAGRAVLAVVVVRIRVQPGRRSQVSGSGAPVGEEHGRVPVVVAVPPGPVWPAAGLPVGKVVLRSSCRSMR